MKTIATLTLILGVSALTAQAATKVWNDTSTDFNAGSSWTGGAPNSLDIAQFNVFTNQPVLNGNYAVGALDITASGFNLTGASTLILHEGGVSSSGAGTNTIGVAISVNGGAAGIDFDVDSGNTLDLTQTLTFSGKTWTKTGAGVLKVGTNTATAGSFIEVLGGTLHVVSGGFSGGATSMSLDGGRLFVESASAVTTNGNLTMTIGAGGGTIESAVGPSPTPLRIGGVLAGSGDLTFTTSGNGRLIQLGDKNNTHNGDVFIDGSNTLLRIAKLGGVTDVLGDASIVTLATGATLDLNIGGETVGGLEGTGFVQSTANANTITVGGGDRSSEFAGTLRNNTATLSLAKTGTGTFTLSGTNTYTGSTTINAGTLLIAETGDLANTATSIAEGATLGGGGNLAGTVTTTGMDSRLSPHGHLSLGALDATAGGTFSFGLGTDQIHVAGLLTGGSLSESLQINVSGGQAGIAYTLFEFGSVSGLDAGDFDLITEGYVLDASFHDGGWWIDSGLVQVQFAVIPEPTTWMMMVLGAGLTALVRRRKK